MASNEAADHDAVEAGAAIGDLSDDAQLASALRMTLMRLERRLRAERTDEGPGLSQLSALSILHWRGPMSPTALAEAERIQPPSMTRVIAHLEEGGLVRREPHPTDRRQSVIAITDAGREMVQEDRQRRTAWLTGALSQLSPEEREKLAEALPVLEKIRQLSGSRGPGWAHASGRRFNRPRERGDLD